VSRQVLRGVQAAVVVVVAAAAATVPASPGVTGEKQRTVTEAYTTSPSGGVDCATGEGGACFELVGDEFSVRLGVEDDEGWRDLPLRSSFTSPDGQQLSSGDHCGKGTATVPAGAALLTVAVSPATVGTCSHPTVSRSGTVTAAFDLKRHPREAAADDERRCTGGLGEPLSYTLSADDGRRVAVDALILMDGVDETAARELMAKVTHGFADDGVDLLAGFQSVSLAPSSLEVQDLFAAIKASVGGEVPQGFELVHVLTDKDIVGWAGYAFCVGGIRSRDHAFSMSEMRGQTINIIRGVPAPAWFWGDDYLAAHEIGHLFGGGHDLANCAEGVAVVEGETPAPCTLMHPNLNVSYVFSTINRAIVRGHALDFADGPQS
jgi:hypothetical protein